MRERSRRAAVVFLCGAAGAAQGCHGQQQQRRRLESHCVVIVDGEFRAARPPLKADTVASRKDACARWARRIVQSDDKATNTCVMQAQTFTSIRHCIDRLH